jgi:hypothetical protein
VTDRHDQAFWARLFRVARALIRQVNIGELIIDHWSLGGGTGLMLQIDHRESHDVDIFLQDAQLLSFLDPEKHDFTFEIRPSYQDGDGATFLKLGFKDIGEIDFIVAQPKTKEPAILREIEGETALLETIPEIVAKKIVYRGSTIQPRDLFDIAAAAERHAGSIIAALRPYRGEVKRTLEAVEGVSTEFVGRAISQLLIRERFRPIAKTAIERTKELLRAV